MLRPHVQDGVNKNSYSEYYVNQCNLQKLTLFVPQVAAVALLVGLQNYCDIYIVQVVDVGRWDCLQQILQQTHSFVVLSAPYFLVTYTINTAQLLYKFSDQWWIITSKTLLCFPTISILKQRTCLNQNMYYNDIRPCIKINIQCYTNETSTALTAAPFEFAWQY